MNYKRNFIKCEAVKETYRGIAWTNNTDENTNNKDKKALRKDDITHCVDDENTSRLK